MFERLKTAFLGLASAATQRTLSENEIDGILDKFEISLLEGDVALEVVKDLREQIKRSLAGLKISRTEDAEAMVKDSLRDVLREVTTASFKVDIVEAVKKKKAQGKPCVIVFLGINGTGKTTTIAKVAHMLKDLGYGVVVGGADTHRAGAIEQLSEHARRLSVKIIAQKYGADPAAVARDAVLYAEAHGVDAVLIDTAGRMQTSKNLMDEMAKIIRVVTPDVKIFVADSLAGNDAVSQAKEFMTYTGFDGSVLTKADADAKGGAAISIAHVTGRPIMYLGMGQSYGDLQPFDVESFVSNILP